MPIAKNNVSWAEAPEINFWEQGFLPAIVDGIRTTLGHVINYQSVTQQYPEVKPALPLHYRGVHRLNRDDVGNVKCVACYMCSTACPANCITIVAQDAPSDWVNRDKFPQSFVLDELRCIYCGMCEEACPCDAIELTHIYDLTGFSRSDLMFDKERLLDVYDQTKDDRTDPVRTRRGRLGVASEFVSLPTVGPATEPDSRDRASKVGSPGKVQ